VFFGHGCPSFFADIVRTKFTHQNFCGRPLGGLATPILPGGNIQMRSETQAEDEQLLAEQGVLSDEIWSTAGKVSSGGRGKRRRVASRVREVEENLFER
jgi:hypothetical protein